MTRFAPEALARVRTFSKSLREWVACGYLTGEQADALAAKAVHIEVSGTNPRKVRCATCNTIHAFVGRAQQFTCCNLMQSVWDCRVT